MTNILVINGPNLNLLGLREPEIYGEGSYADLVKKIENHCRRRGVAVKVFQTNHEGAMVDEIQAAYGFFDGIVINPGAYTHTSIALLDALLGVGIPAVEVHISDIFKREDFRKQSYIRSYCVQTISGRGFDGYIEGIECLLGLKGGEKP